MLYRFFTAEMEFYSKRSAAAVCLFVLTLSSPSFVYGGQTIYDGDETVNEGGSFSISCFLTLFDPVHWEKDGRPIASEPGKPNSYTFLEETIGGKVKASVVVETARAYHTGSYRCNSLTNESHFLYVISDGLLTANFDYNNIKVMDYGERLELQCNETNPQPELVVKWFKLDKPIATSEGDRPNIVVHENSLVINRAMEDEVSNYTCKLFNTKQSNSTAIASQDFFVVGRPYVKLPETVTVIQGEKLKLECIVIGGPGQVTVDWIIGNKTYDQSKGRVTLSSGTNPNFVNNLMELEPADMEDRGDVSCLANNMATTIKEPNVATVYVRVKDKYAALWPFLGIVAEVIVLCTVIFIYEKKRNKAELEESDTDQSPEQKNTPDHGKDSVRQRK